MQEHRLVVVDDSALMRRAILDVLKGVPGIRVVGEAATGPAALQLIREVRPDLVSLDLELPGIDGLSILRTVMNEQPTKVVFVSSHTTAGADATMQALRDGAIDFVPKASLGEGLDVFARRLETTFRAAQLARLGPATPEPTTTVPELRRPRLVVVASSTGGPQALRGFVGAFTEAPRVPILIVQHMPARFTTSLASSLDVVGPLRVREAEDGSDLVAGTALVAPGGFHLVVERLRVRLSDGEPIGGLKPRADVSLGDAARTHRSGTLAVVLTGMGDDGLAGCAAVAEAGGQIAAQDGDSAVVDGMPRAVRQAGLAEVTGTPAALGAAVLRAASSSRAGVPAGRS